MHVYTKKQETQETHEQCDRIEMTRTTLPSEEIKQKHIFVSGIDGSRKYSIDVTGPPPPTPAGGAEEKFQNVRG